MGGLFGGKQQQTFTPPVQTQTAEIQNNAKKGATDLEKMRNKKSLQDAYGKAMSAGNEFGAFGFQEDTTLAAGSLLSLGSKLG